MLKAISIFFNDVPFLLEDFLGLFLTIFSGIMILNDLYRVIWAIRPLFLIRRLISVLPRICIADGLLKIWVVMLNTRVLLKDLRVSVRGIRILMNYLVTVSIQRTRVPLNDRWIPIYRARFPIILGMIPAVWGTHIFLNLWRIPV